jgi:two-component system, cell cycle response regulator
MTVATVPASPVRGVLRVLLAGQSTDILRRARQGLRRIESAHVLNARTSDDAKSQLRGGRIDALIVTPETWENEAAGLAAIAASTPGLAVLLLGASQAPYPTLAPHQLDDPGMLEATVVGAVREARSRRRKETMVRWLERESCTDALTGLLNRRGLQEHFDRIDATPGEPIGIVLLNVVGTGMVNHNYGEEAGDRMIRRAARGIVHTIRGNDVSGRLEGDTFAVLLSGANLDVCRRVARRISQALERINAEEGDSEVPVAVTFGMATGLGVPTEQLVAIARDQIREQRRFLPLSRVGPRPDDGPSVA